MPRSGRLLPSQAPLQAHEDPGLQPERTSMSWARTAMAMLVVSLTLLRWANAYGPAIFALITVLVVCAIYVVSSNRADYLRDVHGIQNESLSPNIARVMVMVFAVTLLGLGAVVLVLTR